jgi:hypothetical protein
MNYNSHCDQDVCCRVCNRPFRYLMPSHQHAKCRRLSKRIKELETELLNKEFELFLRNYYHSKLSGEEV